MPFSNNANKLFSHHIPNLFLNSTINKNPLFPKSYLQFHSFVADANTKNQMGSNIALYIVVSVVFFAISKIVMAVLCYRRWKRRQMLIQDSFRGASSLHRSFPRVAWLSLFMPCYVRRETSAVQISGD